MKPVMMLAAIDDLINPGRTEKVRSSGLHRKLRGILFSIIIAAIPIFIVWLSPPRMGGVFVAGYLMGAITAPLVVIAGLKAADDLLQSSWLHSSIGTVLYFFVIVLISAGAVVWSLYFAAPGQ